MWTMLGFRIKKNGNHHKNLEKYIKYNIKYTKNY